MHRFPLPRQFFQAVVVLALGCQAAWLLALDQQPVQPQDGHPAAPAAAPPAGPRPDRYGDPLPAGAIARLGSTRFRFPSSILILATMPDGQRAATVCQADGALQFCDLKTGQARFGCALPTTLNASSGIRRSHGLYLADGGKKAILAANNRAECITVENGASIWQEDIKQGVILRAAVAPDGKTLGLITNSGRVLLLNAENGKLLHEIVNAGNSLTGIAFSHDGRRVAVTGHNLATGVRIWDVETAKEQEGVRDARMAAVGVAFSPDGNLLALALLDGTIEIFEIGSKQPKHTLTRSSGGIRWLSFSPTGQHLAALEASGHVLIADSQTGKLLHRLPANSQMAVPSFLPDGKTIATATGNVIDLWNLSDGQPQRPVEGHRAPVQGLALSPNSRWLASLGADQTLRLWSVEDSRQIVTAQRESAGAFNVRFSNQGSSLVWANNQQSIQFLDVAALTATPPAGSIPPASIPPTAIQRELSGEPLNMFVVSANGLRVSANVNAGGIQTWDLSQKNPAAKPIGPLFGLQAPPLAISSDGQLTATPYTVDGSGRSVVIADLPRERRHATLVHPSQQVAQGAFAAGGRLFLSRASKSLLLWDVLSSRIVLSLSTNPTSSTYVTAFDCTEDGRLIAWAESDSTIHVFDALVSRELARFQGHAGLVQSLELQVAGDRPLLSSGGSDTTILVWNLAPVMEKVRASTPRLADQDRDRVWADLASEDGSRMHRASWILASAADEGTKLIAERLAPVPIDREIAPKVERQLQRLDDDSFSTREQASVELADLGEPAEPFLRESLKRAHSAEVRHRVRRLLAELSGRQTTLSPDQQRDIRAVQILEQIGTANSKSALLRLASGEPAARLTQEAQAALARIQERP